MQNACNIPKVWQYRLASYRTSHLCRLTSRCCIYDEFKKVGQDRIRFSLQLSNGKERVADTKDLCVQAKSRTKFGEHNDTNCSRFYSEEECILTFYNYAAKII